MEFCGTVSGVFVATCVPFCAAFNIKYKLCGCLTPKYIQVDSGVKEDEMAPAGSK